MALGGRGQPPFPFPLHSHRETKPASGGDRTMQPLGPSCLKSTGSRKSEGSGQPSLHTAPVTAAPTHSAHPCHSDQGRNQTLVTLHACLPPVPKPAEGSPGLCRCKHSHQGWGELSRRGSNPAAQESPKATGCGSKNKVLLARSRLQGRFLDPTWHCQPLPGNLIRAPATRGD